MPNANATIAATTARYTVAARLPDGQGPFNDEEHVCIYAGERMTKAEAEAAIAYLDRTRPEGHENVTYEMSEAAPAPFEVGDKVDGGKPGTDDFDTGSILEVDINGTKAYVGWDCGVSTWTPFSTLRKRA